MSAEKNKMIVRRFIEEVINTGNLDNIEEFISPDYAEFHEGSSHPVGIEGAKAHVTGVRQTYHNLTLTIERQIAEGEWVATCYTARGIHNGAFMGMKPTGKEVAFPSVNINRVVGGRIVEHGGAAYMLGALLEAGAVQVVG